MKISSAGSAIPETASSNAELESRLGLQPGWIERRTGIRRRPIAPAHEATSDLAVRAGKVALERAAVAARDIGLLILATSTPDHLLPPTAPLVAHKLGLERAGAIDLTGACAGFLYALTLADSWGETNGRPVLIIAANILTRRVNNQDASTAALFSDGAGAVVLTPAAPTHVLGTYLGADGSLYDTIGIESGGTREPLTTEGLQKGRNLMTIRKGAALFKQAVQAMVYAGKQAMEAAQVGPEHVSLWIPHQANTRIIRDAGASLDIPAARTIDVIADYGNSSAATIPIALNHAIEHGWIHSGDVLLFTAAGAGLVSAGLVLRW